MSRRRMETACLLAPALIFLSLLFVLPLVRLFSLAFTDEGGALATFAVLAESEVYRRVMVNTLLVAAAVTLITVVLAWPVSYALSRLKGVWFGLALYGVLFPFWISVLVRTFSWMILLERNGPINRLLQGLGVTDQPLALLAAGVKREEVFPYTIEKADMALGKIKELKPNVSVWWGAGAQPPQLLSTGELALSDAWSGRMLAAEAEGAPVGHTYKDGIAWANWWVIPKGSPNAALAHEPLNFALAEEQQAKLLALKTYGPVPSSATSGADAETRKVLVMAPENIKDMLILSEQVANKYSREYEEKWNQLMLG